MAKRKSKSPSKAKRKEVIRPELGAELERIKRSADGKAFLDWDISLTLGEMAENELTDILTGEVTVEVKRDFRVSDTGNIAIEISSGGKPSGITTTKAKYWAIVLDGPEYEAESIIFIKTERLRCLAEMQKWTVRGGDKNRSLMKLVPVRDLYKKKSQLKCDADLEEHF